MSDDKKSRILLAARSVFLRYGFKRVSMNDIADAAGVSRPALYVLFRNKEEIFIEAYLRWVDEAIVQVEAAMAQTALPKDKLARAFEIWAVGPFEMTMASREAEELLNCNHAFAHASREQGYAIFEATITPVVAGLSERLAEASRIAPSRMAHVLVSAVRGFKQTAATPDDLRRLIDELLQLTFGPG
jgi:TetR/AcrR family transcriptional regulator of autoinduction and epiphytic fitness